MKFNPEILIDRIEYTNKLKSWLNHSDIVKIITGVRRCGKSKLFVLFQNELLKTGIADKKQILNINLDNIIQTREIGLTYNGNNFFTNYEKLLDYVTSRLLPDEMNYIFIDEIQLLENWFLVANALRLISNVDLYLTGSNAYMFSKDLANSFGGRYVEIKMHPFSFKEYYNAYMYLNNDKLNLQEIYYKYITESGFPQKIGRAHV